MSISLRDLLLQLGVDEATDRAMNSTLEKSNQLITETQRISKTDAYMYDVDYVIIIMIQDNTIFDSI